MKYVFLFIGIVMLVIASIEIVVCFIDAIHEFTRKS